MRRRSVAAAVAMILLGQAGAVPEAFAQGRTTIARHDRSGDGRADLAVIRGENGNLRWYWQMSSGGFESTLFGSLALDDQIVTGDFDGDNRDDPAVWRPGNPSIYFVQRSSDGAVHTFPFGEVATDSPVEGDFDGDGRSDFAVVRYGSGGTPLTWIIHPSSGGGDLVVPFGQSLNGPDQHYDVPAPADYDGDGRTDIAVSRATYVDPVPPSGPNLQRIVRRSSGGFSTTIFGTASDDWTTGDVNGDGSDDIVIIRQQSGTLSWFVHTGEAVLPTVVFGNSSDRPFVDDIDGDRRADIAVYRPSTSTSQWFYRRSATGAVDTFTFGHSGDLPLSGLRTSSNG